MSRSVVACTARIQHFFRQTLNISTDVRNLPGIVFSSQRQEVCRGFHVSSCNRKSESKKTESRRKKAASTEESKNVKKDQIDPNLRAATIEVAKSLPNEWTKTAEELLARLQLQKTPNDELSSAPDSDKSGETGSLLSSMPVGKTLDKSTREGNFKRRRDVDGSPDFENDFRKRVARKKHAEMFNSLSAMPRLNIFDVDKLSKQRVVKETAEVGLWEKVEQELVNDISGGLPRNAFEEMIEWTNQGKVWVFPVDNEADLHEEKKCKFHDHVFLEQHLTKFPDKGPIRKFMELVVLGLSQNPWLSVPEKVEHIQWFEDYFKQKQSILESSIGEHGKMKESQEKME